MNSLYLELLVKYFHFASIFTIISCLAGEFFLLKPTLTRQEVRRIANIDGIYGLASIVLVAAGLTLWFGVGKPAEYYTSNWIFHLKWTLFVVVGILSIIPTIFFMKQRKGDPEEEVAVPSRIKNFVRIELIILFIIPILASIMAKGIGLT
jgi:putative membrane protein